MARTGKIIPANAHEVLDYDELLHRAELLEESITGVEPAAHWGFTNAQRTLFKTLQPNKAVRRESLLAAVDLATGRQASFNVIDVHVCKMRKKLREYNAPWMIETSHGVGYILRPFDDARINLHSVEGYDKTLGKLRRLGAKIGKLASTAQRLDDLPGTIRDLALEVRQLHELLDMEREKFLKVERGKHSEFRNRYDS